MNTPEETKPASTPVLLRRTTVIVLILFVSGALTIPLVIQSPAFSRVEKWCWSIFAALYTGAMLFILFAFTLWAYWQFREGLAVM